MSDLPSAWVALWNTPASIDWCEHNYNVHDSIAEFYNTLSSFAIAGAGVLGLCLYPTAEVRFQLQYVVILIVGLGSVMFHATLQYHMQLCDELPMVYAMLVSIFTMRNVFNFGSTTWLEVLPYILYGVFWTILHAYHAFTIAFQVQFGVLVIYSMILAYRIRRKMSSKSSAFHLVDWYVGSFHVAFYCCWLVDRVFCSRLHALRFNPQLHAWWHVITAFSSYVGPVYTRAVRLDAMKKKYEVSWVLGVPVLFLFKTVTSKSDRL